MNNENYIDYMVEDEMTLQPKKAASQYPVIKIIAMVLGIIASLAYLYYAIENVYKPYVEQFALINEYKASGMMEISFSIYLPYYISIASVTLLVIAPLVGALLPKKLKSISLILFALPVSWQAVDALPALISYLTQGTPVKELLMFLVVIIASLLSLAAAIISLFIKNDTCDCDECMVEFYEYDDKEIEELTSLDGVEVAEVISEEVLEEAEEAVEELFEEVKEEIKEDLEENK